jgi:hypothetical protein
MASPPDEVPKKVAQNHLKTCFLRVSGDFMTFWFLGKILVWAPPGPMAPGPFWVIFVILGLISVFLVEFGQKQPNLTVLAGNSNSNLTVFPTSIQTLGGYNLRTTWPIATKSFSALQGLEPNRKTPRAGWRSHSSDL